MGTSGTESNRIQANQRETAPDAAAIGIDLGGTNLRAGLVTRDGVLGECLLEETDFSRGPEPVMRQIKKMAGILMDRCPEYLILQGIGVGAPGPLDARNGVVLTMPNLPGWEDFPMREQLERVTDLPVTVMNDADAAAWGEHFWGGARNTRSFAMLTLGTGLGSSLFLEGRPWLGASGISAEFGHIPVTQGGPICSCGRIGHLESYLSARRLLQRVHSAVQCGFETSMRDAGASILDKGVSFVVEHARTGDRLALREMELYARFLGRGFAILVNLLNLPLIILGGGISAAWDLMEKTAVEEMTAQAFEFQAAQVAIRRAELGGVAGILGAAVNMLISKKS